MKPDFEENEFDTTLDALIAFLDSLPKETVKMINPTRYERLIKTAAALTELLRKNMTDGEVDISLDPTFLLGSISTELSELSMDDPRAFANIICQADNIEIYPLSNGNLRLNITFQRVLHVLM